jgi:ethanolamine utilization microcompartment shell protein EutL
LKNTFKENKLKKYYQLSGAILLFFLSHFAYAHSLNASVGNSKSNTTATDVFIITCGSDDSGASDHLDVQIKTISPKNTPSIPNYAKLNVQIIKDGILSSVETDPINGDKLYSPFASLVSGPVEYTVIVTKPLAIATTCDNSSVFAAAPNKAYPYTLQYHCKASNGNHTPTSVQPTVNQ